MDNSTYTMDPSLFLEPEDMQGIQFENPNTLVLPIEGLIDQDSLFKTGPEIIETVPKTTEVTSETGNVALKNAIKAVAIAEKSKKVSDKLHKIQNGRISKRKTKKYVESCSDDSEDEFSYKKAKTNRKVKLYEQDRFDDPAMEQKRQNAINAKQNRERKKKEAKKIDSEMAKLKQDNQILKKKNKKYRSQLSKFQQRLEILEAVMATSGVKIPSMKSTDAEE